MTFYLNFDSGNLASEEAAAISTLLSSIAPILPNAKELAARQALYAHTALTSTATSPAVAETPVAPRTEATYQVHVGGSVGNSPDKEPEAPQRERGKPAPGRSRRTKEEIAEDEAADAAEATGTTQGISTGGERVGPEDDAETQAQDAADEKAEVEETRKPAEPLTVDDVKAAVGQYVTKFGLDAAQQDGPALFVSVLGAPPEGEKYWKMSILPASQEKLQAVVSAWKKAAGADARWSANG